MLLYEIEIRGRVQGVGFRYFVLKKAREMEISGFVKNRTDGSVFVSAEGNRSDLDTLVDSLRTGPHLARVDEVIISKHPLINPSVGFIIK